jgi:hypothetical protein
MERELKTAPKKVLFFAEATTGFEPVMRALQAPALPLGHVAINRRLIEDFLSAGRGLRAGDETRTRDLLLGKEVFYQLNYARTVGLWGR